MIYPAKVTYKIQQFFFDRAAVDALLDKQEKRFLGHVGGWARKTARRSMRPVGKSGKPSDAPDPPRYHSRDPVVSLRNILYGYDPTLQGVIVGPVLLNQRYNVNSKPLGATVPEIHEKGGRVAIREKKVGGKWVPMGRRKPWPGQQTRTRIAVYPERPIMEPVIPKARAQFKTIWYGSSEAA